jgi:hypothetical protein
VIASAGPATATRMLLQQATDKMLLPDAENRAVASSTDAESPSDPPSAWRRTAAHCWALLLVRIYECLPLICPRCGEAMRIVAFIQDPPVIERILHHIGEPTEAPQVLPARAPPQHALEFDQSAEVDEWPNEDQTAGDTDDFVE